MIINLIELILVLISATEVSCQVSKVSVQPKSAAVLKGGNIVLECKFTEMVTKCSWYRNGSVVDIKGRYKYMNRNLNNNGENTTDCSIEIRPLRRIDATQWHCSCAADSSMIPNEACRSNNAYLEMYILDETENIKKVKIESIFTLHPKNAPVLYGSITVLYCHLKNRIKRCTWYRNDKMIPIKGRYEFVNFRANGRNTNDCSIIIRTFRKIDATRWQCSYKENSSRSNQIRKSKTAILKMKTRDAANDTRRSTTFNPKITPTVLDHPPNTTVAIGSNISQCCEFNENITEITNYVTTTALPMLPVVTTTLPIIPVATTASPIPIITSPLTTLDSPNNDASPDKTSSTSKLSISNILHFIVIGLFLGTMLFLVTIYCRRRNKGTIHEISMPQSSMTELPNNHECQKISPTQSIKNLHHPQNPEEGICASGDVWSFPSHERRDRCLPLPEADKILPSYYEEKLHHDDLDEIIYEQIPNRQSTDCYASIDGIKNQPSLASSTMTNDCTCNPLYAIDDSKEETVDATKPEVGDDIDEIARFATGFKNAIYTRIRPKRKPKQGESNDSEITP